MIINYGVFKRVGQSKISGVSVRGVGVVKMLDILDGAREGTRTPTGIPLDPKSSASASSATLAFLAHCQGFRGLCQGVKAESKIFSDSFM